MTPLKCIKLFLCVVKVSFICRLGSSSAVGKTRQKHNPVFVCVRRVILNPVFTAGDFSLMLQLLHSLEHLFLQPGSDMKYMRYTYFNMTHKK